MSWLDTFTIALRALFKNKMRASLTMLGVVIGIAAVTTMVSVGESASGVVQGEISSVGSNVLVVTPAQGQSAGVTQGQVPSLTPDDARAITRECESVAAVSPIAGASAQVIGGNMNWRPKEVFGVGPGYLTVRNWQLTAGEFFTERDVTSAAKVCVIGQTLVTRLFSGENPINQQLRVKNIPFRIVGVLEKKGADLVGNDQDDILLMPYTTALKRLEGSPFSNVSFIMISAKSQDRMNDAEFEVRSLLLDRHRIAPGQAADFEVHNLKEAAAMVNIVTNTMTMMLSSIAAISLLVGGVGIMNIMLVSVTERTREIGVRMAVGAKPMDILWQFLVEAVVLSSVGGVIGIIVGVSSSWVITSAINYLSPGTDWPFVISIPAAIVALIFAAAVGVFFGLYPAWRASMLDPIDALRYE
jgi:putative ABC transport system permease protein